MTDVAAVVMALVFAAVMGANDGAALVSVNRSSKVVSSLGSIAILAIAITAIPILLGTGVADTIAEGLVRFPDEVRLGALVIVVAVSTILVAILARAGLPTSLTLALVGSMTGVGVGQGLEPNLPLVMRVLAIGAVTPVVAIGIGAVMRLVLPVIGTNPARSVLQVGQSVSFTSLAFAYGANDGQKALGVLAATGSDLQGPGPLWNGIFIALAFSLGTLLTLPHVQRRSSGLASHRPHLVMTAQFGAALAVGVPSIIGIPASMTQSVAAGLIGTNAAEAHRRIRWDQVGRLLQAWMVTLPLALLLGTVLSWAARTVFG